MLRGYSRVRPGNLRKTSSVPGSWYATVIKTLVWHARSPRFRYSTTLAGYGFRSVLASNFLCIGNLQEKGILLTTLEFPYCTLNNCGQATNKYGFRSLLRVGISASYKLGPQYLSKLNRNRIGCFLEQLNL